MSVLFTDHANDNQNIFQSSVLSTQQYGNVVYYNRWVFSSNNQIYHIYLNYNHEHLWTIKSQFIIGMFLWFFSELFLPSILHCLLYIAFSLSSIF